jgi:hypothetical protein
MLPKTLQTRLAAGVLPTKSSPLLLEPLVPVRLESYNVSYIYTHAIENGGCRTNAKGVGECISKAKRGFKYKIEEDRVSLCLSYLSKNGLHYDGSENAIEDKDGSLQ